MTTPRAILCAWTVAFFEAGLVLSSIAHFATTPWFLLMAVLAPVILYGTAGWFVGKIQRLENLPWAEIALLGCVCALHMRRQIYIGTNGWWMVGLGALVAVGLWLRLRPRKELRTRTLLNGVLLTYLVLRLRQYSKNDPAKLEERGWLDLFDYGVSFPQDATWLIAWILLGVVLWRGLFIPLQASCAARIPKLALGFLLLVPASLLYLQQVLQQGPVTRDATIALAPKHAPNVVLVSWDTVRADTLPLFGGGGLETPHLDGLAEQGILFENYHTVAPITAPAHNSMLTGLLPPSHGLRANGDLATYLATPRLPDIFRDAGWDTGAFVSVQPVIGRDKGFALGFDYFDDRQSQSPWSPVIYALGFLKRTTAVGDRLLPDGIDFSASTTPGFQTTQRSIDWIRARERPFFAWVHLFDAHDPRDLTGEYEPFIQAALANPSPGPHAVNEECEESLVLQRGEVAFLDDQLGKLLEALREKDPGLGNTIIAVVADHGECFGEGAHAPDLFGQGGIKVLHVPSLYEATQHVIGLIVPAGASEGMLRGSRHAGDSSHIDLLPTLVELAGLSVPEGIQGRSLAKAMKGESLEARPLYMEAYGATNGDDRLVGLLDGEWKYVATIDGRREFLFHFSTGDGADLAESEPERVQLMREQLEELRGSMQIVERAQTEMSAEERSALSDLGYGEADEE
ncbi:MAG: sulfatase [Planctomycetes bacterium]|nr:sulfatase [Planctomycetota bacterium]